MPHGWVNVELAEPENAPYQYRTKMLRSAEDLLALQDSLKYFPNEASDIRISLHRAVHVHGTIHLPEQDRTTTGIRIWCDPWPNGSFAVAADERGKFDCYVSSGNLRLRPYVRVKEATIQCFSSINIEPPDGLADYTVPTIDMAVAHGRVTDEDGKPAKNTSVLVRMGEKPGEENTGYGHGFTYPLHLARTDVNGQYHLLLARNRMYFIAFIASDPSRYEPFVYSDWKSPPSGEIRDIVLRQLGEGRSINDVAGSQELAGILDYSSRYDETVETEQRLRCIGRRLPSKR
jgi:hypothetical protein